MTRLLVLFALGCAVAATLVGFGWVTSDDGFGWLALSVAAYFAADAVENR